MDVTFSYPEALLGLTTVIAWADDQNHVSEVDSRVQMILHENISEGTIDKFQAKYKSLSGLEETFNIALDTLKQESKENQGKALAWMWLVANVSTPDEEVGVDYGHLEEVTSWKNQPNFVDLDELVWINRAKKELKLTPDEITSEFNKLPEARRI